MKRQKSQEFCPGINRKEVISYGKLDTKTSLKLILVSLIAIQTLSEYKVTLGGALNVG